VPPTRRGRVRPRHILGIAALALLIELLGSPLVTGPWPHSSCSRFGSLFPGRRKGVRGCRHLMLFASAWHGGQALNLYASLCDSP
jgi:hypothetical protein